VDDEGNEFRNSEQYMMYRKAKLFGDDDMATLILTQSSPKEVKALGRKVKPFDDDTWRTHARNIVADGLRLKFAQNEHMKATLLSTGTKVLVEASPFDNIWGIGLSEKKALKMHSEKWPGTNWLGECLMRVRDEFRAAEDESSEDAL